MRYVCAEYLDRGDFASAAGLFADARLRLGPDTDVDADTMLSMWRADGDRLPRLHTADQARRHQPDRRGRRRGWHRHVPLGAPPACGGLLHRLQQTDDFPVRVIVTGRYDDRFERVDGRWRFCYRDCSLIDQAGDLSHHLSQVLG